MIDLIKKAGVVSDAKHTPSNPLEDITEDTEKEDKVAAIQVSISPDNSSAEELHDTLDQVRFSSRVFEPSNPSSNTRVVTRSGRTSKPILGSRLIDEITE